MAFISKFKRSALELRSIKCIATVGVLLALAVILDGFGTIRIGEFLKINFTFLPLALIGILFGPTVGLMSGLLVDLIGYIVNPIGAFIPWLMLITGLEGLIYGLVLYNVKAERTIGYFFRIVISRALVCGICNLVLNTWALYSYGFISGESLSAVMIARVSINIITFCLGSYMMMVILIPVKLYYGKLQANGRKTLKGRA